MGPREAKKYYGISGEREKLFEMAVTWLGFSARAYERVLKATRTIANFAGDEGIRPAHISEAIHCRMIDRYY